MLLSVYVVPTICEPLVRQSVSACANQFPHLLGLELADVQSTGLSMSVDMLVGSDYYWELVTGSICREVSGPVAIHTKLGWVLSGPSSHEDPGQCAMNLNVTHILHVDQIVLLQELRNHRFYLRACYPLWFSISTPPLKAGFHSLYPLSLATTHGISLDFFSS